MPEEPRDPNAPSEPPAPPPEPQPNQPVNLARREGYPETPPDALSLIHKLRARAATGQPVSSSLPDPQTILLKYNPDQIKQTGEKLEALRPYLETTYRATIDIEAFGDPDYQNLLIETALLRRRLETMGAAADEVGREKLARLLERLAEMEKDIFQKRTAGLKQRTEAEKELIEAQEGRDKFLRDVHHRTELDAERDQGIHKQRLLAISAATEEIERQIVHRGLTQPELANEVRAHSFAAVKPTIDALFDESNLRLKSIKGNLDGMRGRSVMIITLLSQLASGALSASGIASMSSTLTDASLMERWAVAGSIATVINGTLYWLTRSHQNNSWRFFRQGEMPASEPPGPPALPPVPQDGDDEEEKKPEKKMKTRKNKLAWWRRLPTLSAFVYLLMSAASGVSNVGGMMRIMVPNAVVKSAIGRRVDDVTEFTAEARKKLTPKSDLANKAIAELREKAQKLLNETIARGDTTQFGFRRESIKLLKELDGLYRTKIDDMVKNGNCDALEILAEIYNKLYDDLEKNRQEFGVPYARAPFSKSLGDLSSDKKTCEKKNPKSAAELVDEIEKEIQDMMDRVEKGAKAEDGIKDPTELNPQIYKLNQSMTKLAKMLELSPKKLDEMSPPMFEAVRIVAGSLSALYDSLTNKLSSLNPWGNNQSGQQKSPQEGKLVLYSIFFLLFSEIIDQVGLILSLTIIANERRLWKKLIEQKAFVESGEFSKIDNF